MRISMFRDGRRMVQGGRAAGWFLSAVLAMVPLSARPQDEVSKRPVEGQGSSRPAARPGASIERTSGPKGESMRGRKLDLAGAARVSAQEATRGAAADLAKKAGKSDPSIAGASRTEDSAVIEFRPVASEQSGGAAVQASSKDSKKSILKNIHGSAYGSLDPGNRGNHESAASVGATSKSGKTSVYIEGDHSRTSPSAKP